MLRCFLLSVSSHNEVAERLYRRAGFEDRGDLPRALHVEGRWLDESHMVLTSATYAQQVEEAPIHTWPLASWGSDTDRLHAFRTVGQIMTRDVFTLHPEDVIDLAANLMDPALKGLAHRDFVHELAFSPDGSLASGGYRRVALVRSMIVVEKLTDAAASGAVQAADRPAVEPVVAEDELPLVSCIMPTYNRRALVPQAIEYFLRQDYPRRDGGTGRPSDGLSARLTMEW